MRFAQRRSFLLALSLGLALGCSQGMAASLGNLNGFIQDQAGQPVANVLISLLQTTSEETLPILTRSDAGGEIHVKNIQGGNYEIRVKSSRYRNPEKSVVRVVPGQTTVATFILQQLLQLDMEDNLSVKTLLRTADDRRLIFRTLPGPPMETTQKRSFGPFFEEAAFEVYSNAGLDGDYFVFPGDSSGGTTTNFAVVDSAWGNNKYVLAGQLNSGEDSLWRLKNFVDYSVSDFHTLRMFVGYGRMSFSQPSLSLLSNPTSLGSHPDYTRALGTTKIMSLGLQESVSLSSALSFVWGVELNQVQTDVLRNFVNPNAEIAYSPSEGTRIRVLMASKRETQRGSLLLPDGDMVNLSDAVYFSRVGNDFNIGTSRHYQGSVTQQVDEKTDVEFSVYENQMFGGAAPFLAVFEFQPDVQVLHLSDEEANNQGYRVTVRRHLGENLKAAVSYIRGNAVGVNGDHPALALVAGDMLFGSLLAREKYNAISTEVEAYVPSSGTRVNALVKFVTNGDPITTLDAFSDVYETGNEGINLFIRQVIPVPAGWLSFVGLDFLSTYQIEALLDIRNLTNEDLGKLQASSGDFALVRYPRSVRGGISVRF